MNKDFIIVNDYIPNIIIDLRYYSNNNFVGNRIDGYKENYVILTKEAAKALKKANEELLEQGLCIKIFDAYRPQKAVDYFYKWSKDLNDIKMKNIYYPNILKKDLFKKGFISLKSSHSRGSTIDLTIFDLKTNEELDMGGFFDYFDKSSYINYKKLTKEQYNNRLFLNNIMSKYGFKGLNEEWWHYTLINEPFKDIYFDFDIKK